MTIQAATTTSVLNNNRSDSFGNDGSIVGLPNSSDEDSSTEELTSAADAMCRTLLKEQQQKPQEDEGEDQQQENKTRMKSQQEQQDAERWEQIRLQSEPQSQHQQEPAGSTFEESSSTTTTMNHNTTSNAGNEEAGLPNLSQIDTDSSQSPSDPNQQQSLEDRVHELEIKLATLSRILQQQQRLSVRSLLARSPSNSQRNLMAAQQHTPNSTERYNGYNGHTSQQRLPAAPLVEDVEFPEPGTISPEPTERYAGQNMVPYLESPAPIENMPSPRQHKMHQRKRLSFHLLYDGNEDNLHRADDEDLSLRHSRNNSETLTEDKVVDENHEVHPLKNDCNNNSSSNRRDSEKIEIPFLPPPIDATARNLKIDNNSNKTNLSYTTHKADMEQSATSVASSDQCAAGSSSLRAVAKQVVKEDIKHQDPNKASRSLSLSSHSNANISTATNSVMDASASTFGSPKNQTKPTMKVATGHIDAPADHPPTQRSGTPKNRIQAAIAHKELLSKDKRNKWLDHLNSFQETNHDVDVQMQEFIKVPGAVERTLLQGFFICVDSFLYVLTILPIRFAWSCILLSLHYPFKWMQRPAGNLQFHRRHTYQLIQVTIIFIIYRYLLLPISIGKLYHWIRGQAMIKLYVVIAMVEVFDRLMCSLGQDCLDSLYWNTTRRPRSSRMVISALVVAIYTAVHSLILFVHVATLNVAMNSADEALLALLIAGNFAEIKSTVFKKYNKPSLFKIVASDICERFKLALFLGLVLLLNFCQGMDSRKMSDYQRIALIVWMSELLCDWLKHAFITKFNFIPSSVYPEYALLLAGDVTGIGHEGVNLDHSHAVVKRIGFAQMPLVCVMARLVREAGKYMFLRIDSSSISNALLTVAVAGAWGLFLILKLLLGAYLQRTSLEKLHAAPELSQTPLKTKQKQQ